MSSTYYIWSTRAAGWVSAGGSYVSSLKDAQEFDEVKALERCKLHYKNGMSEFGLIPVAKRDLQLIRGEKI